MFPLLSSAVFAFLCATTSAVVLPRTGAVQLAVNPQCGTLSGGVPVDVNVGLGPLSSYKTIVAFGDSYTAGPTNGATWVQNLANSTGARLINYAASGAVVDVDQWPQVAPVQATASVDFINQANKFITGQKLDPASTLYIIFFGIGDYAEAVATGQTDMTNIAGVLVYTMLGLVSSPSFAQNILIVDNYGLGKTSPAGDAFKQDLFTSLGTGRRLYGWNVGFASFNSIWEGVLYGSPGGSAFGYSDTGICVQNDAPIRAPPSPRAPKRTKFDHLIPEDFKNGIMLAPMVRSGALPTRLFALKHGATLVWGPEMVDKAMLHAERAVDPVTGVISYNGKSRAMFTTHPIEKPYLIFQIGSSDPELAVQAARIVMNDVSGIDLNCGCPKPFSTHSGMGAALLTNPDLLCSILTALRAAMPPEITVSAKIRLLPSQEDTLKLVERIVNTGISALTVHCRTRTMRDRDAALVERLKEIVDFVAGMGKGIAVIENGDCVGAEDAKRIRDLTGAHSVMIARAAEANPSCFSPSPLNDLERTLCPAYLRVAKYLDNNWGLTKFCVSQFKGKHVDINKAAQKRYREVLHGTKGFDGLEEIVGSWTGEDDFREIVRTIEARPPRVRAIPVPSPTDVQPSTAEPSDSEDPVTPPDIDHSFRDFES
ncbi:tRNA-dihydrouridine synthase 2 [Mycena venus]|uniref:tRNA-dihydrouridine synthase 2 n=1 Tax=Mycena venus TaxID=2733690 RepID=A0A8H6XU66_9AGAR|nr:tRNA-dihydrouridine synthase 2 [Mycena venus]